MVMVFCRSSKRDRTSSFPWSVSGVIEELTWLDADPVQHQPPATPPRRTPSVSPPSMNVPPSQIVFGPERLGCRVPTFDKDYNLVSLNNHELAVVLKLPPNGTALIVTAMDATPAYSQGQENLESAHFAYANGAIPGTNLKLYYIPYSYCYYKIP